MSAKYYEEISKINECIFYEEFPFSIKLSKFDGKETICSKIFMSKKFNCLLMHKFILIIISFSFFSCINTSQNNINDSSIIHKPNTTEKSSESNFENHKRMIFLMNHLAKRLMIQMK